jgi:hypothetical protein
MRIMLLGERLSKHCSINPEYLRLSADNCAAIFNFL